MKNENFDKEFISRTIKIVEKLFDAAKREEYEVTFLLNCLLGLIVTTNEDLEKKESDFFDKRINSEGISDWIPNKITQLSFKDGYKTISNKLKDVNLTTITEDFVINDFKVFVNKDLHNLSLKKLIRKIRNGIAHKNIEAVNDLEHWTGVRIWNNKDNMKDFEIEFTIGELKLFSTEVARNYLTEFHKDDR